MSLARVYVRFSPAQKRKKINIRLLNTASNLFDETPQRDLYSLNSLLATYNRRGDPLSTWELFLQMHNTGSGLSAHTFTPVLRACAALPNSLRGPQVHSLMIKLGIDSGPIVKTALIDTYSKHGQLGSSVIVFNEMGIDDKDVIAWNTMISTLLRHGFPAKALSLFEEMKRERAEVSEFTLCSVLKACAHLGAFRQGKQAHAMVIVKDRDLVVLSSALVDFYSSCGYIDEAFKVYRIVSDEADEILRNSLISGCVRNKKYDMAMSLLRKTRPNLISLTSALSVCSENTNLLMGKQIHGVAIRKCFVTDTPMCNVLLDMYAKCGEIAKSRLVFDRIPEKDVVSWTSMIDAYGTNGYGNEALGLFKKMEEKDTDVKPNSVTMLAILSACGHSGLVDQGKECFSLFKEKYFRDLGPEHFACFTDILGRAGLIEDVWRLFRDMVEENIEPTSAMWLALLNACQLNRDCERGDFVARKLVELEPNTPSYYVAVSNFYAACGKWNSVGSLRSDMKDRGVVKEQGNSWVSMT